jgi:hypothetical protein
MSTRLREKPFVASGFRKVRGWIEACRSLQRRWWSVIGAGARWRCATTRNGRTNQCWNRGCLEAGSLERRSVSPCWCWRPTFIIQASKAPAVASSDTARSATGGFGAMQQRSLCGNLVLLFADATKRFSGPLYDLRPRQAM